MRTQLIFAKRLNFRTWIFLNFLHFVVYLMYYDFINWSILRFYIFHSLFTNSLFVLKWPNLDSVRVLNDFLT
jgi:hypothetical protein